MYYKETVMGNNSNHLMKSAEPPCKFAILLLMSSLYIHYVTSNSASYYIIPKETTGMG